MAADNPISSGALALGYIFGSIVLGSGWGVLVLLVVVAAMWLVGLKKS